MKKRKRKRKSQPCNLAAYHALFMTDSRWVWPKNSAAVDSWNLKPTNNLTIQIPVAAKCSKETVEHLTLLHGSCTPSVMNFLPFCCRSDWLTDYFKALRISSKGKRSSYSEFSQTLPQLSIENYGQVLVDIGITMCNKRKIKQRFLRLLHLIHFKYLMDSSKSVGRIYRKNFFPFSALIVWRIHDPRCIIPRQRPKKYHL